MSTNINIIYINSKLKGCKNNKIIYNDVVNILLTHRVEVKCQTLTAFGPVCHISFSVKTIFGC